jgi:hypothetical protein
MLFRLHNKRSASAEVIIDGRLEVSGQHIWLHGLTIQHVKQNRGWYNTLSGEKSSESIVITNCQLIGNWIVHTPEGAAKYFVADNTIRGVTHGEFQFTGEGVDFVEPDYAHENNRVWYNRCYNGMSGFSWQPMRGGPWYFFNNLNVGAYSNPLKVVRVFGPTVLANNTLLSKSYDAYAQQRLETCRCRGCDT